MTTKIEDELRELFGSTADGFEMGRTMPPWVRKRARARAFRAISAVMAVGVVGSALGVATLRDQPAGPGSSSSAVPRVRLVSYTDDQSVPDLTAAQEQVQCLRDQGFDVPDPVSTDTRIELQLPSSIDQSSLAWREALFVTCAMSKFWDQPPPEGLVFVAATEPDAQALVDCMQAQGFDLPAPTQQGDRYEIDLRATLIDTTSDTWNQALFVACTPAQPPWGYPSDPSGPTSGSSGPSA